MGASGARALVKNWKVARIAAFACIGGVLYGYNQVRKAVYIGFRIAET